MNAKLVITVETNATKAELNELTEHISNAVSEAIVQGFEDTLDDGIDRWATDIRVDVIDN